MKTSDKLIHVPRARHKNIQKIILLCRFVDTLSFVSQVGNYRCQVGNMKMSSGARMTGTKDENNKGTMYEGVALKSKAGVTNMTLKLCHCMFCH